MNYKNAMIYTEKFCFEKGAFSVEDGKFCNVLGAEQADAVDLEGAYVIPGLIDVHNHGNSGADFSDGDSAGVEKMARYLARNGVTSFAPASMTLPYETLKKAFAAAREFVDRKLPDAAVLRGIQMEGPFFAEAKKGAQNGAYLRLPDYEAFAELNRSCGGLVKIVDVAPELDGAEAFIRKARRDCTVSIAHSDADYEAARRGIAAGVTHLTHLYNAMPGLHHRKPGTIAAAAEAEQVSAEIISDGYHVHPAMVRLAFRLFGAARMVLISDALRCCGMPNGEYELGGQQVYLNGGVAKLADGTLAGSVTNLYDCMLRAISFGIPREEAVRAATYNPARQIGALDEVGSITDGKRADFVLCDAALQRKQVCLGGRML